ncbi:MAG: T9SS type A sorting domain-containing protein [Bacteroidota bacterium]
MCNQNRISCFCCFSFLFFLGPLLGQTNISGIINQYSAVTAIDLPNNTLTLSAPGSFAEGDNALLIQMQGASIVAGDSPSFGEITAYGGAGNYELVKVCAVIGNDVVLEDNLVNSDYAVNSRLQLVSVPDYNDATVVAPLSGQAWNGSTGGVLALTVKNVLTVNADINMDGKGYRGGEFEDGDFNCNWTSNIDNRYYSTPDFGGRKGESFADYIANREYGRGTQGSGGGGGNDHNSGGGGGANGGAGGQGGENREPGFFNCDGEFQGTGGRLPDLTASRIFMGSGGGAGHGNNDVGTSGGHGGGIIIIIATNLTTSSSATISANGNDVPITNGQDGGGGGGGGGSIQLEIAQLSSAISLSVTGGQGGDTDNQNNNRCFGPGGGGGGGLIRATVSPLSSQMDLAGGAAGQRFNSTANNCMGNGNGEPEAGDDGQVQSFFIPRGNVPAPACLSLPVSWESIRGTAFDRYNQIDWEVSAQFNNDYFEIERSLDGRIFTALGRQPASTASRYQFKDFAAPAGLVFYRVRQVDYDGSYTYSGLVQIDRKSAQPLLVFPNPTQLEESVQLRLPQQSDYLLQLYNSGGQQVRHLNILNQASYELPLEGLPTGIYHLRLSSGQQEWSERLLVIE